MAKKSKERKLTRRQLARRERDQQLQRILIWSAVSVAVLVVAVLGYGVVTEFVIKPQKPVARVGDAVITTRAFQARLRYERMMARLEIARYRQQLDQLDPKDEQLSGLVAQLQATIASMENQLSPNLAEVFGGQVLDRMIEEELVLQEAAKRGLTVTEDEIDRRVEQMMGSDREAAKTVTDTTTIMTEQEYRDLYQAFRENVLGPAKFSEKDYRRMVKADLLIDKLKELLGQEVEDTADQVEVVLLAAGTEEEARALQARLDSGEDVDALVEELNGDDDDKTVGFDLPWLPVGYLDQQWGKDVEKAAFDTPVGQTSSPVMGSGDRYYVVYVRGHEERPLSTILLQQARETKYGEWLSQQRAELVERVDGWEEAVISEP